MVMSKEFPDSGDEQGEKQLLAGDDERRQAHADFLRYLAGVVDLGVGLQQILGSDVPAPENPDPTEQS